MLLNKYPDLKLLIRKFLEIHEIKTDPYNFTEDDVEVRSFPQTWGSTALGFGGVGGNMITTAQTTVVWDIGWTYAAVFYGEELAYFLKPNRAFMIDVLQEKVGGRSNISRYRR